MSADFETGAFATRWNALERSEKMRLRRTVRMGRRIDEPELAHLASLAPSYARWQLARPWMRYFWFWFVPGIFIVLGLTAQIHPIFVGVTIALGAQAVFAYINLRKAARTAT